MNSHKWKRWAALAAVLSCSGCGGGAPESQEILLPSAPVSADPDAGTWQMIALTGAAQFSVPAPASVKDSQYQAELASIKSAQSQISLSQRRSIDYWAGGGVLRWNQITRELVSRSDLPPAPRDDGTYPVPDPSNPFADPQFPFANPPYAARAYSYVAVAQYEALKTAWYYKYLYSRPAPARVDAGIQTLAPLTDLPAYPSEDAVVSAVSFALLKLLFPTSIEEISARAEDQRQAALLSGKATASDIAAGVALGEAVAAAFVSRAASDGMRTAGSTASIQGRIDAAIARGDIPWRSLENPPRPPMLPGFGKVQTWIVTPVQLVSERPPPPPPASSAQMAAELVEVKSAVNGLTNEQLAIVQKWSDGASSPTPPGHWNAIAVPHISAARFSEVRAARALALLNMALHDAAVACWDTKFTYFNARPSQLDPGIRTAIALPNFPSYESGHSTFSAAAATVLSYLFPQQAAEFEAQKEEAAISRLYGGIHYRSDIEVGKQHGNQIGQHVVEFAQRDGA